GSRPGGGRRSARTSQWGATWGQHNPQRAAELRGRREARDRGVSSSAELHRGSAPLFSIPRSKVRILHGTTGTEMEREREFGCLLERELGPRPRVELEPAVSSSAGALGEASRASSPRSLVEPSSSVKTSVTVPECRAVPAIDRHYLSPVSSAAGTRLRHVIRGGRPAHHVWVSGIST